MAVPDILAPRWFLLPIYEMSRVNTCIEDKLSAMLNQMPILAASACVFRRSQVLLVKRGNALGRGLWSLPGGKIEADEQADASALRELLEETGISARLVGPVGNFEISIGPNHYSIACFAALHVSGEPQAASDAVDAKFIEVEDIDNYTLAPNTREAISASRILIRV